MLRLSTFRLPRSMFLSQNIQILKSEAKIGVFDVTAFSSSISISSFVYLLFRILFPIHRFLIPIFNTFPLVPFHLLFPAHVIIDFPFLNITTSEFFSYYVNMKRICISLRIELRQSNKNIRRAVIQHR